MRRAGGRPMFTPRFGQNRASAKTDRPTLRTCAWRERAKIVEILEALRRLTTGRWRPVGIEVHDRDVSGGVRSEHQPSRIVETLMMLQKRTACGCVPSSESKHA